MPQDDPQSKASTLQKQLQESKGLKEEQQRLTELRARLSSEIANLENGIHHSHYKPQDVEPKKRLLEECQRKCREIDHRLDELEEWTDEQENETRERLKHLILARRPELSADYSALEGDIQIQKGRLMHLQRLKRHLSLIIEAIEVMVKKRAEVKRRSVLSYIVGPSPNHVIGICMSEIIKAIETCLADKPDSEELCEALSDLAVHCKSRWGFKTIDRIFAPSKEKLCAFLNATQEAQCRAEDSLAAALKKRDDWLERHSQQI